MPGSDDVNRSHHVVTYPSHPHILPGHLSIPSLSLSLYFRRPVSPLTVSSISQSPAMNVLDSIAKDMQPILSLCGGSDIFGEDAMFPSLLSHRNLFDMDDDPFLGATDSEPMFDFGADHGNIVESDDPFPDGRGIDTASDAHRVIPSSPPPTPPVSFPREPIDPFDTTTGNETFAMQYSPSQFLSTQPQLQPPPPSSSAYGLFGLSGRGRIEETPVIQPSSFQLFSTQLQLQPPPPPSFSSHDLFGRGRVEETPVTQRSPFQLLSTQLQPPPPPSSFTYELVGLFGRDRVEETPVIQRSPFQLPSTPHPRHPPPPPPPTPSFSSHDLPSLVDPTTANETPASQRSPHQFLSPPPPTREHAPVAEPHPSDAPSSPSMYVVVPRDDPVLEWGRNLLLRTLVVREAETKDAVRKHVAACVVKFLEDVPSLSFDPAQFLTMACSMAAEAICRLPDELTQTMTTKHGDIANPFGRIWESVDDVNSAYVTLRNTPLSNTQWYSREAVERAARAMHMTPFQFFADGGTMDGHVALIKYSTEVKSLVANCIPDICSIELRRSRLIGCVIEALVRAYSNPSIRTAVSTQLALTPQSTIHMVHGADDSAERDALVRGLGPEDDLLAAVSQVVDQVKGLSH